MSTLRKKLRQLGSHLMQASLELCIFPVSVFAPYAMLSRRISAAIFLYNVLYLRNNKTLRALNQLDGFTEKDVKL